MRTSRGLLSSSNNQACSAGTLRRSDLPSCYRGANIRRENVVFVDPRESGMGESWRSYVSSATVVASYVSASFWATRVSLTSRMGVNDRSLCDTIGLCRVVSMC